MTVRPSSLLLLLLPLLASSESVREKRHLVLVPSPPVVFVPAAPPIHQMMPGMRIPLGASSVPCGTPAFTCQGSCTANGVGGIPGVKGEYPWLVQLYTGGQFFCSGSIIDNYFILTSASCIEPATPTSVAALRVRVGDFKLNTNEDGFYQERNVTTIFRHTDYIPKGKSPAVHDIALLKLTEPLTFNEHVRPICLDSSNRVDTGFVEGVLSGYGKLSQSSRPYSPILHKVQVRIGAPQECQSIYSSHGIQLKETNICAGTPTLPSVDPCVGDDGGPLFVKRGANTYEQVGVASFGLSCAGPPAVFTRVGAYRAWIEEVRRQRV